MKLIYQFKFLLVILFLFPFSSVYYSEDGADKNTPGYYFRPWKTMLVRTVSDGGKSFYQQMAHKESVPQLWAAIMKDGTHGR